MLSPHKKRALLGLGIALAATLPFTIAEVTKEVPPPMPDFKVYVTAAELVREHKSADIYDGADTGADPQLRPSPAGSPFYNIAVAKGVNAPGVYVYLPTLADALVPLAPLPLPAAVRAWLLIDVLALFGTAVLLGWMLGHAPLDRFTLLTFLALLLFRADMSSIYWGQVTIILLLLWTGGIACFAKRHVRESAIFFALATAIKLTPAIVILPMLFWRQWRWTAWYFASLAGILGLLCWVNGPRTVADFFFHVMPPMSGGVPGVMNATLASGINLVYAATHPGGFQRLYITVPRSVTMFAKAISLLAFVTVMVTIYRARQLAGPWERAKVLGLVAVLSLIVAPVSWRHAYTISFPILFLLWLEAFSGYLSNLRLLVLTACTIEFAFIFDSLLGKITHGIAFAAAPFFAPCAGLVLIFSTINAMKHQRREVRIEATSADK